MKRQNAFNHEDYGDYSPQSGEQLEKDLEEAWASHPLLKGHPLFKGSTAPKRKASPSHEGNGTLNGRTGLMRWLP